MAQNQYKRKLATASLFEAQAMDKAYTDALKNKQKTYTTPDGLKYAVKDGPRTYAADIVGKRLKDITGVNPNTGYKATVTGTPNAKVSTVSKGDTTVGKVNIGAKADSAFQASIDTTGIKPKPITPSTTPKPKLPELQPTRTNKVNMPKWEDEPKGTMTLGNQESKPSGFENVLYGNKRPGGISYKNGEESAKDFLDLIVVRWRVEIF